MLDALARLLGTSTTVAALVLVLVAVQLTLQVYALADLARRDRVRGDRKWVWVLVIAFGNLVGAVAYLVAGRSEPEADGPGAGSGASTAGGEAARRAVETLYGPPDQR